MNVTDQNDDVIELAEEHLGRDLMELVLQEIKAAPDVWQKMPEAVQGDVIDRVQRRIESAVKLAVNIIAANGMTRVLADLEGVAIKDDIKATFKVSRANSAESLQALYDAHNKGCLLIVATPEQFTGGMHEIQPDPDQPDLPLADVEEAA